MTAAKIPLTRGQRIRQAANLLNGSTALGILLASAAGLAVVPGPRGLLLAAGYRWPLPVAGAFTVGNVVIFRTRGTGTTPDPRLADPILLHHEERHASQYAAFLGLPFLPLYFAAAAWSMLRTGNPGSANAFERHAGLQAGGYPLLESRWRTPWKKRTPSQ
ncbi:hypothetical protein V1639_02705 [Pseudarthrobacter sp. J75]|uniref:hypothetical protein n=1 Tax=unclassified Pseudarthrobacter TaxID=2647000 RepID=UPI002E819E60|nr:MULTISPECIES: hypothetical protein [unclassified Pseudarthrobacter]MEE2521862.1 hypothetical protein [Pseudarthrobacter sp. J47]MEE2527939.1 hypothetical protein [Pseudarthrobacter sp. J75]MEE2569510.1 hypothetical protein [Pseudarthrobacter sp. J64]